jgi:hypothetical protein
MRAIVAAQRDLRGQQPLDRLTGVERAAIDVREDLID